MKNTASKLQWVRENLPEEIHDGWYGEVLAHLLTQKDLNVLCDRLAAYGTRIKRETSYSITRNVDAYRALESR